eukprot:2692583-Rhodomonas_salina.2
MPPRSVTAFRTSVWHVTVGLLGPLRRQTLDPRQKHLCGVRYRARVWCYEGNAVLSCYEGGKGNAASCLRERYGMPSTDLGYGTTSTSRTWAG